MDTPTDMFEKACLLATPSHFKVSPMLRNAARMCGVIPGAMEGKSRASKTNGVRTNLSADDAQSIRPARAQHVL